MPSLRTLHLWCWRGNAGLSTAQFEQVARATPRLQSLRLGELPTEAAGLENALPHWPALREVHLSQCRITQRQLLTFAGSGRLARLRSLTLHEVDNQHVHDNAFLAALAGNLPELTRFDVSTWSRDELQRLLPPERARLLPPRPQEFLRMRLDVVDF
jgi:hypothetical protein